MRARPAGGRGGPVGLMNQQRELAILFGDVAGSTRLYDLFGDRSALEAVDTCLRLMSEAVTEQGGTVVKTIGDEVMASLPSVAAGYDATAQMQRRIDALPPLVGSHGRTKLAIRVGFHFGPVIAENDDFFGDTVNLAARMVGIARAGQIVTTGEVARRLPVERRGTTRHVDRLAVRGKAEEIEIVEVLWQSASEMTRFYELRLPQETPVRPKLLTLRDRTREHFFSHAHFGISLGRDPNSDVVLADTKASRRHATIERRKDKWVLVDHSTNGTFITVSGEQEQVLRRDEVLLRGEGRISFGHPASDDDQELIRFSLD